MAQAIYTVEALSEPWHELSNPLQPGIIAQIHADRRQGVLQEKFSFAPAGPKSDSPYPFSPTTSIVERRCPSG